MTYAIPNAVLEEVRQARAKAIPLKHLINTNTPLKKRNKQEDSNNWLNTVFSRGNLIISTLDCQE